MLLKIRKIGNSYGVIIPRLEIEEYLEAGEVEIFLKVNNVITPEEKIIEKKENVITPRLNTLDSTLCKKHKGSYKYSCGCE